MTCDVHHNAHAAEERFVHSQLNVLAPIDLARDAEAHVRYSINVAKAVSGKLTLLYVSDPLRSRGAGPLEWPASAMAERTDCHIQRVTLRGSVVETVTRYAEEADSHLLVLGSHHYGSWARVWKDSLAASIVASTHRPVWVTKKEAISPAAHKTLRRILCLVSLDGTDESVVRYAESITAKTGGELHLLHVIPEVPDPLVGHSFAAIESRRMTERSAVRRLEDLADTIEYPHSTSILGGSSYTSINRVARDYGADLVVTGRPRPEHTQKAASTLDLRTLVNRLRCPLLSVAVETGKAESLKEGVIQPCLARC